jgi:dolichyl-phosphate-mannose-protein mannosyltransferase
MPSSGVALNATSGLRSRRSGLAQMALVFGLALVVRLVCLFVTRPAFDSVYWSLSDSLVRDGSLALDGIRTTAFEPLYPMFLAFTRIVVADSQPVVQAAQCIVASVGGVFLFRMAASLRGRAQVGLLAGTLYAFYPLLVRHSADGSDAALMTTMVAAFAAQFVSAATPAGFVLTGLWLGLAILTRSMALPLVPIGAAVLWRRRGWRAAAVLAGVSLMVVAPYAARNHALNGAILSTRSGLNLFISNSPYTSKIFPDHGPDVLGDYVHAMAQSHGIPDGPPSAVLERARDVMWTRLAFEQMVRNPADVIRMKANNVALFFSPRLVPYHDQTEATRLLIAGDGRVTVENAPPRPWKYEFVFAASYGPVLALALIGVWLRRNDLGDDAILWCILLTFVAVHAVYFPTTRYRVPVEFVFLFYAAVALDRRNVRRAGDGS